MDAVVEPFGVSVAETTDPSLANVIIDMSSTSSVGGYTDGILGCYNTSGEITLISGWNWYAGSDPTQISSNQYDFQTTVTHELGHALGLGESDDPTSAMVGTLSAGTTIRTLNTADLNIPYDEGAADPQRAAVLPTVVTGSVSPTASWIPTATANPIVVSAWSVGGWNSALSVGPLAAPTLENMFANPTATSPLPALRVVISAADFDVQGILSADPVSPYWDNPAPVMDWLASRHHSFPVNCTNDAFASDPRGGGRHAVPTRVADRLFGRVAEDMKDTPAHQAAVSVAASQAVVDQATLDQCFSQMDAADLTAEDEFRSSVLRFILVDVEREIVSKNAV